MHCTAAFSGNKKFKRLQNNPFAAKAKNLTFQTEIELLRSG